MIRDKITKLEKVQEYFRNMHNTRQISKSVENPFLTISDKINGRSN